MDFKNILKIVFILLMIQNVFFYIALFASGSNDTVFHALLYFDVFCYLALAIFLVLQGLTYKIIEFTVAGICFFLWVGLTLIWRSILNFYSIGVHTNNTNTLSNTINTVYIFYVLAGLVFAVGIYLLSKSIQYSRRDMILINAYGIVNLISVVLTIEIIGLIPKLLLVPLLGIIAYSLLSRGITRKHISS